MKKKTLAYHDANQLIQGLLSAMIMEEGGNDEGEEIEISTDTNNDSNMQNQT